TLSYRGFVLLIEPDDNRIRELDRNKKVTLNLTGLLEPRDAQWIGDDRLLVAECKGMRVTERDVKGNLLWVLKLDWRPTQAERLPNGDTFIVGENQAVLFNRNKKELVKIKRPDDGIRTARKLPNGHIVVITNRNQYIKMDRNGKELKTTQLPHVIH